MRRRTPSLRPSILIAFAVSACGPDRGGMEPTDLRLLELSEEPLLQIGVVEGDERYTFARIAGVLRRPDGGIAVSDAGSIQISLYDAEGAFVRRWGSRGEGPGELQALSRIYAHGGDSILAADPWAGRISVFGADGEFGRQIRAEELSGDSVFALDVWLHRRFWVDGALGATERDLVRATLNALPAPRAAPGYRLVRVTRDGGLWIREPEVSADGVRTWTIVDASGRPTALVRVPDRFDPQHIERNEVLGRWRGVSDVDFVRSYGLRDTGGSGPIPRWLVATPDAPADSPPPDEQELRALFRDAIRGMASAQEIHYSRSGTYTTMVDSLAWERPEGIEVDFAAADARGWAAVFSHPAVDRVCGLGYGNASPPGWAPGAVHCAPAGEGGGG